MSAEWANFIWQIVISIVIGIVAWFKFKESLDKKFEHAQKNQSAVFAMQAEMQKKSIDRVYERMDERTDEANRTFVRLDVHNLTIQHLEEKTGEKFKTVMEGLNFKIDSLTDVVRELKEFIMKNRGINGND